MSDMKPTNAREALELIHADIRSIRDTLSIPQEDQSSTDPAIEILSCILTGIQELATSQELLHRRLDAVSKYVPGAGR
jgi:hypothetical protein